MYDLANGIFQALLGIALASLFVVFLFYVRKPKTGKVVAHCFTPGRRISANGAWYGLYGAMPPQVDDADCDRWEIEIIDYAGNTSWIRVSQDAFLKYQYGSQYP